jgi:hypothetical protein
MSKRRLTLIGVLILVAVISLAVMRSRLVGNPEDACAGIPPGTRSKQNPGNAVIQIISPRHGTGFTTTDSNLPIVFEVNNFEPKENLKIALWVDRKPVDGRFDVHGIMLGPGNLTNSQANEGTHDFCLAPLDSRTDEEVGNRVGMRVYLRWRGPDQVDFSGAVQCCLIGGIVLAVGLAFGFSKWLTEGSLSGNLDKID